MLPLASFLHDMKDSMASMPASHPTPSNHYIIGGPWEWALSMESHEVFASSSCSCRLHGLEFLCPSSGWTVAVVALTTCRTIAVFQHTIILMRMSLPHKPEAIRHRRFLEPLGFLQRMATWNLCSLASSLEFGQLPFYKWSPHPKLLNQKT